MKSIQFFVFGAVLLFCGVAAAQQSETDSRRAKMIEQIDSLLDQRMKSVEVIASPPATDSEFLRRAYLDLTGAIPRVADAREFLADEREDKRAKLIDRLLQSPTHLTHMAITWRNIMLPEGFDQDQLRSAVGLQRWFRDQFARNMRYDRIVDEFLVASGSGQDGPTLFYTSLEAKPEKLAAATSRIFLGIQIDCAQCHDHPYDRWTQKDFWGYAAFFARLRQQEENMQSRVEDLLQGEVMLPDTEDVVLPKYPGGRAADPDERGTRRRQLAIWMASRDNPYLAKAAVNRAWAHMFGRGLVEPVDDLGPHNPASHPELLDELSGYFVRSGFDLRELYRTIANTRSYGRTSRTANDPPAAPDLFNRMAIKSLTPEQLYDSLNRILIRRPPANIPGTRAVSRLFDPRRQAFVAKMQSPKTSPASYNAGVPQALTLMNGGEIREATDLQQSGLLGSVDAPFLSDEERVDILFLATLSRLPTEAEQKKFYEYARTGSGQSRGTMSNILWALLNSAEFGFNH